MSYFKIIKNTNRNLVYLIIAFIVVSLMYITEPKAPTTPSGVFLPTTEQNYPPQPDEAVKIYNGMTSKASIIGQIRVELHFTQDNQRNEISVLNYARHLAAQAGANGLEVITFFGTPQPGLEQRYILIAKAVITPQ